MLSVLTHISPSAVNVEQHKFQQQLKQCLDIFHIILLENNLVYSKCFAHNQRSSLKNIISSSGSHITDFGKKNPKPREYSELKSMDECYTTPGCPETLILLAA